jgi:tetratricopeptide (TPR) repeat protein
LEEQCELHIRHDPSRPRCARGLAELYAFKGNVDRAKQWMANYLERRVEPDPEAGQIYQSLRVATLNSQALALQSKGDLAGAEPLFRAALALAERVLGPDHPDTAGSLNNLAGLLEAQGDYGGAEAAYRRAVDICERKLGPNDPRTAASLDNLAGLLQATGNSAAAEPLYQRALTIAEKSLGPGHPTTDRIRENLGALHKRR